MADAVLPPALRSVSGTYAFALTGRCMGMDGITQGAAPLALGYALLPLQGGSSTPALFDSSTF